MKSDMMGRKRGNGEEAAPGVGTQREASTGWGAPGRSPWKGQRGRSFEGNAGLLSVRAAASPSAILMSCYLIFDI